MNEVLKGVIFDLDGTLVDSRLDFVKMRADTGTPEGHGILEHIENLPDDNSRAHALAILRDHEMNGARAATIIAGIPELLLKIESRNLKSAIFTRNESAPTDFVVNRFFSNTFDHVITRNDAPAKPDPTGLLRICQRWKCQPTEVLYVGDYDFDLEAGLRAGIKTVLYLSNEPWPTYASKAAFVTRDFHDFAQRFDEILRNELGFGV